MVATIAQAASSAYYLHSQRSFRHPTEYYTAGEEPDGVWFNPNDLLGLSDDKNIDSKDFHRLYNGFHPETGGKLTRNAGSDKRSPGLDITFSADKSVSALWAIADEPLRTKVEEAHNAASRLALQEIFLKECSYTRTRVGGADGDIHVIPAKILGAMFQHGASRAEDPQLHTHCVIFNAVQTEQDGVWRALHQKPLFLWIKAAGACYRSYLASNLAELGIKTERYGKDNVYVRVQNVPGDLEKEWSKRRTEIVDTAAHMGFETADNPSRAAMVNIMTRASKRGDQDPELRHIRWKHECEELYECASLVASVFDKAEDVTQERIREWAEKLDDLPHVLTRLQAVFRTPQLAEALYNMHNPSLGTLHPETIQSAIDRIVRNPELVALDREPRTAESIAGLSHTVPLSTRHTLQMEKETRDFALTLSQRETFALPAQDIQDKIQLLRDEDYPLSDEQASAIEYVAGRSGAVSIIEGAAGSGKTTTIRPIIDLYKQHGYNIIATAIAWRTAVELANDCDVPPHSAEQLLTMAAHDKLHLDNKSIIIVEEAGQLPTRHTHRILKLAEENGAKVILLGDTRQQQPIEAGPGLRLVHDVVGSHRVDTIRRQLPDAEDVLRDIHGFDPEQAIAAAAALSPAERARGLSEIEGDNRPAHLVPWQIGIAQNFKDGNAQDAIDACYRRGRLHLRANPESTINKLVDDWRQYVTESPDKSSVVLARTHQELKFLSLQMRERIHADQVDPKTAVVTVSRGEGKKREYYNLEIRTGDRLRLGASRLDKKLYTGSLVTVEDLSVQGAPTHHAPRVFITARDDRGRRITFYHDEIRDFFGNIRLDHGFALTMTAAQGITVDRAFVLADDAPARETIYPAATRHRERLDLYVSRDGPLNRIKSNMPDQGAALETEITDKDVLDHLATRWSRHQPKEAATDYTSEELLHEALQSSTPPTPKPFQDPEAERPRYAAPNDNSHTLFSWASSQLRRATLEFRYGHTVAMVAQGHREVSAAYDTLREQARKDGAQITLSPAFNNTLIRHAQVLSAAEPFRRDPERFRDLLRDRGSLDPDDLELFANQYDKARGAQRHASNDTGRNAATDTRRSNKESQPDPADRDSQATVEQSTRRARSLPSAAELSASLASRAEDVCRRYLPHGKRDGDHWTAATVQPDKEERIQVALDGPNTGKWHDRAGGSRGDLLDLIRHSAGYGSIAEAMKEAAAFLDPAPQTRSLAAPAASPLERAEAETARAQALYDRARPITDDDPAGRYLANHGLDLQQTPGLRYHDNVHYLAGDDLRRSPAILAPITSADGTLRGLDRLFLTPAGDALPLAPHTITGHAPPPADAATWIGERNASNIALCQSIPDALSLLGALDDQERKELAVVTLPDTCDLTTLQIPTETRNVLLVQADDDEGAAAWQTLRATHANTPLQLHRIATDNASLDDVLQGHGRQALRDILQPLADAIAEPAVIAALERFHRDWDEHVSRSLKALVHPLYAIGHAELIDRLRELGNQPAVTARPASELKQIDFILAEDRRQTGALTHVQDYLTRIEPCRALLQELHEPDVPHGSQLHDLPAYKEWRSTAEQLLKQGNAIAADYNRYGACLNHTFDAWNELHYSIRELERDLGHDTSSLRHQQPELCLEPITRPVPTLDEAKEADASYRRLRYDWNKHMAVAEAEQVHPCEIEGYASMIETIQQLRDRPHLDATARNALDPVLSEHARIEQARTDIDTYLSDTQDAFRRLANLKNVAERLSHLGVELQAIGAYQKWKQETLELARTGKDILADQHHYRIHLKQNPDLTGRIHASVQDLTAALRSEEASIKPQEPRQVVQQEQTTRQSRSIKP